MPTAKAEQFADGILVMSKQNEKVKGFNVAPFIDGSFLEKSVAKGLDKAQ